MNKKEVEALYGGARPYVLINLKIPSILLVKLTGQLTLRLTILLKQLNILCRYIPQHDFGIFKSQDTSS